MKLKVKNFDVKAYMPKFLEGGEMATPAEAPVLEPAPEAAPQEAPAEGGDPTELILQAAMQAVLTQDGQLALQVCQAIIELAGAGAQEAPGAPVYKMGGKLSRWI